MKIIFSHPLKSVVEARLKQFEAIFSFEMKVAFDEDLGMWVIREKQEDEEKEEIIEEDENGE